jgi:cytosine deaminase
MDLIIRKTLPLGNESLNDIGIKEGLISKIAPSIQEQAKIEIDARGNLVCPGFVDSHLHLDKVFLADRYRYENRPRIAHERIQYAITVENELKKKFTVEDVRDRAERAVRLAVANGTTVISAHVDIDQYVGLTGLKGILEARNQFKDLIDIQIVAFPQNGIVSSPGVEGLLEDSMQLGADVVGGLPDVDPKPEEQIDILFNIAKKFDADINTHIDQTLTPTPFSLPYMAKKTIEEGYQGRVAVAHCHNLSVVAVEKARQTLQMLKKAEMSLCFNPRRMLVPDSRYLLLDSGVNMALITDNIRDVWNPLGNGDMLLNALLVAFSGYGAEIAERNFQEILTLITYNPARAIGMDKDYGLAEGKTADLVVFDAKSPAEAITSMRPRLYVLKHGKIVAKNGTLVNK